MNRKKSGGKGKASRRGDKGGSRGAGTGGFRSTPQLAAGGRFVAAHGPVDANSESRAQPVVTRSVRGARVGRTGPVHRPADARGVQEDYLDLVRRFPLRPIRDERDYDTAVDVLDALVTKAEDDLTAGERDYVDGLTRFVEDFDQKNHAIGPDPRPPLERLKSLMEGAGISRTGLGDIIGSRPAASMVLSGERELSKAHIRRLAGHFKMDAGYFL